MYLCAMCKMQNESQLCWRRCVNERQKKRTVCSIKIYNVCCNVRCATQCIMQNETQLCWRRCVNEKQKKQTVCSIKSYRALHWMQCKMQCTTQCKMQNEIWLCRGVVLTRARRNKQFVPPPFPSLRQKLNGVTFFLAMKFTIHCYLLVLC